MFRRGKNVPKDIAAPTRLVETASRIVADAATHHKGRSLQRDDRPTVMVSDMFCYGAADPRHLAVWILVAGEGAGEIPPRYQPLNPSPPLLPPQLATAPVESRLADWLSSIATDIQARFADAEWPIAVRAAQIGADAAARVEQGGGWSYFK